MNDCIEAEGPICLTFDRSSVECTVILNLIYYVFQVSVSDYVES